MPRIQIEPGIENVLRRCKLREKKIEGGIHIMNIEHHLQEMNSDMILICEGVIKAFEDLEDER